MNLQNFGFIEASLSDEHPPSYLVCTIYPSENGGSKGEGFVIFSKLDLTYELLFEDYFYSSEIDENTLFQSVILQTVGYLYNNKLLKENEESLSKGSFSVTSKQKSRDGIHKHVRKMKEAVIAKELKVTPPMIESLKEICDKTNHLGLKEYLSNLLATEN